jgi:hypothetical protein
VKTAPDIPISDIRAELNGKVITADDAGYDDARGVFFTGFDHRPAAVVRVADAADVSRVVKLARESATAAPDTAPPTAGSCSTSGR